MDGALSISLNSDTDNVVLGGKTGEAYLVSVPKGKIVNKYQIEGAVTDIVSPGSKVVLASTKGLICVYDEANLVSEFTQHAGKVAAIAIHPSGDILASVGEDKSIVLYDIPGAQVATQIFTNSGMCWPKTFPRNEQKLTSPQH